MTADYVMVGGFLGAGKTTTLLRLAEHLTARGRRVGLITNDQSHGLVDTVLVGSRGYPVREITGGCFCCRFTSLTDAARSLTDDAKPDVFLAEPVGSCTDLRATVQYPLRRLYGSNYRIAPLSVVLDPIRALRVHGLEGGKAFSPKVMYVYRKQLEEADIIVMNKSDLVDSACRTRLDEALAAAYPSAERYWVSARHGTGLETWFERLDACAPEGGAALEIDYDVYAEGEALLGWFNGTFRLEAEAPVDGDRLLQELARGIRRTLAAGGLEIAHCKMTVAPDEGLGDLGVLNLVGSDREPEASHLLREPLETAELIVNLRVEGPPEALEAAVRAALLEAAGPAVRVITVHAEQFRPPRPVPTHRMAG